MDLTEKEEELEFLNQAIAKVLQGGQEIQTRNGRVKLPDLNTLYAQRNVVIAELNNMQGIDGDTFGTPLFYHGRS